YGLRTSLPGCSLLSPRMCGGALRSLKRGQLGRPLPLGSPFLAKLTQYDDISSAILRSRSDAIASFGELMSGITRGAPRLLKTYTISVACVAFRSLPPGSTGGSCVKKYQ